MQQHIIQEILDSLYGQYLACTDGEIATYIPELSKANPQHFGLCVVTKNGQVFESGDSKELFTIQSISKPFTYGMALEALGQEHVSKHVGVEPSGDAFNSIQLEPKTNRPYNPMVNAGAITVSSMLYQHYGEDALDAMLDRFSEAAGRKLSIDEDVYASESRTGHRNRAIAHLLLNFGMVGNNIEPALDLYFKQCSILVNCKDLAMMSATLCNLGKNPVTQNDVFDIASVRDMLSIMLTCGMYDYSGQWAYKVGIPAKSGVAGGVIGVVNRQLGLSCYSPRLDVRGNSCRGIEAFIKLTNELGLHAFDCMNVGSSYLEAILE